jgi:hypothetical protein
MRQPRLALMPNPAVYTAALQPPLGPPTRAGYRERLDH